MYSAVVVALSYLIDPHTPKNDGTFRPITVDRQAGHGGVGQPGRAGDARDQPLRPGNPRSDHQGAGAGLPGARRWPAGAAASASPSRARTRAPRSPRTGGKPFIWHFFQARPGGGASSAGDGWPGAGEWQAAGGIKFGSLEVTEVRFPLFFRRHEFRPDSGGAGQISRRPRRHRRDGRRDRRAGARQHRRRRRGPWRLRHSRRRRRRAAPLHALFRTATSRAPIRTKETGLVIRPGDRLLLESGGGGGWGDPAERDARAIASDVENGFVSAGSRDAGG